MTSRDAEAVAGLAGELGYPTTPAEMVERLAGMTGRPDLALLVAVDATDRPTGWVHVERRDTLVADASAQVMGLVVGDGHRGAGIGRDLLAAAETWARDQRCAAMIVATRVTRRDAHRFYRREGYRLGKTSHLFEKRLSGPAGG